jgi:CRISPR-associated exonuclease Cas4
MYSEDDFLMLSGIQHFSFCRRQWGLIHIAGEWRENVLTVDGNIMHERAHDQSIREHRGDTIVVRGLTVRSTSMGVIGQCDVVEFHRSEHGHPLFGEDGFWAEIPIEYKRGHTKISDADRLQLAAQAMCLEEMCASDIPYGYLYYGETRTREKVQLSDDLRETVKKSFAEMHSLYDKHWIPKAKFSKGCKSCSLLDVCMPRTRGVKTYMDDMLKGSI